MFDKNKSFKFDQNETQIFAFYTEISNDYGPNRAKPEVPLFYPNTCMRKLLGGKMLRFCFVQYMCQLLVLLFLFCKFSDDYSYYLLALGRGTPLIKIIFPG